MVDTYIFENAKIREGRKGSS